MPVVARPIPAVTQSPRQGLPKSPTVIGSKVPAATRSGERLSSTTSSLGGIATGRTIKADRTSAGFKPSPTPAPGIGKKPGLGLQ